MFILQWTLMDFLFFFSFFFLGGGTKKFYAKPNGLEFPGPAAPRISGMTAPTTVYGCPQRRPGQTGGWTLARCPHRRPPITLIRRRPVPIRTGLIRRTRLLLLRRVPVSAHRREGRGTRSAHRARARTALATRRRLQTAGGSGLCLDFVFLLCCVCCFFFLIGLTYTNKKKNQKKKPKM
jgi:hypothetical protein